MSDTSAEIAALKAQLAAVMTAIEGKGVELSQPSIWVVHNPNKRAEATKTWPAIRDYRRENGFNDRWKENIASCSPSNLYSMEWIYDTSN